MNIINLFTSHALPQNDTDKLQNRKVSLIEGLLAPALKIFTRIAEAFSLPLARLTDIEKKELIEKSILNKKDTSKTAIKSGDNMLPLLGQIHADALSVNTCLEQLPSSVGAQAWADLVREVKEVSIPQELQELLDQYKATTQKLSSLEAESNSKQRLYALSKEVMLSVSKLKQGQSFLLEGGRTEGNVKRPVLFKFTRTDANKFDLFVYLPGNSEGYRGHISDGEKNWNRPIIHYQNIPAATHLFFGENQDIKSDFFQAILEVRFDGHQLSLNISPQMYWDICNLFAKIYLSRFQSGKARPRYGPH